MLWQWELVPRLELARHAEGAILRVQLPVPIDLPAPRVAVPYALVGIHQG